MTIAFLRSRALVAGLLASLATPLIAQTGYPGPAPAVPAYPAIADVDPVAALSRYLRMLAANPRDLASLTGAGKAALAVGDANAALGFYARAEEIAPRNGRIKAGLATALVQMERPRTALKLFDEAVALGVPVAEIASDRGLASDLIGDGRRAQADYTLGLRAKDDDETLRRLALSMAISGDRAGALTMLDPLLRKRDGGAIRARAFVLALTGDQAGAANVVRGAMPAAQATVMANFMTRLARLNPAQKALAVNFGYFPSDGRTYSAAELFADSRAAAPPAGMVAAAPVRSADTPLIPQGAPLGATGALALNDADARAPRRRPGQIEAATEVLPPPHVLSAPVPGRTVPVASAPATAHAATAGTGAAAVAGAVPVSLSRTAVAAQTVGQAARPPARIAASPAHDVVAASPPARPPATGAVAPAAVASSTSAIATPVAPPTAASEAVGAPKPVVATPAQMTPQTATNATAVTADPIPAAPAPTAPAPAPPPAASVAGASPSGNLIVTARGPALAGMSAGASEAVAPVAPSSTPPTETVPQEVAAKPVPTTRLAMLDAPKTARPPERKPADAKTRTTKASEDAGEGKAAAAKGDMTAKSAKNRAGTKPAAKDDAAEEAPKAGTKGSGKTKVAEKSTDKADAKSKAADKSKTADKGKATDKGKAGEKTKAAAKAKADEKADAKGAAKSKIPERYWVQVASGSNKANLDRAWDDVKGKAPKLLGGKATYTSPWRASNRLLIGPFKTEDEAQAQVNKLAKAGVSGIQFTTRAGNDVEKVTGK